MYIDTADLPLFIGSFPAFGLLLLPLHHRPTNFSSLNNETYTGDFFGSSGQSTGPRITPSSPDMAAELQVSSRPLAALRPTSHTLSTMPRLNLASTGVTSKLLPWHPRIIRPGQQFLRSESGSYLSLRQMLINSDAPSSRRVNKADLYDLSYSSLQSANLIPKSNPAGRPIFRAKLARPRTRLARHHHRPTQNTALLKRWVAAAGFQRAWATPQISPWQSLTRFPLRLNFSPRLYRPHCRMQPGLQLL